MKESLEEERDQLPSAVDDAASVILESKRKEAFVKKNAPVEKKSSESGFTISVTAILLLVALSAVLIYSP